MEAPVYLEEARLSQRSPSKGGKYCSEREGGQNIYITTLIR